MSRYVTYETFSTSPYGIDFCSCDDSIFASSGEVQLFLDDMSGLIDLYAGRTFGSGMVTDTFVASPGINKIFLSRFPVNYIESVKFYQDGSIDSETISSGSYRSFYDGRVLFNSNLYGYATYEILYNAGYLTIPPQIELATMILANSYALAIENNAVGIPEGGNTTRFVFGKYEENFVDPRQRYDDINVGIPVTVHAILNRFKVQN